ALGLALDAAGRQRLLAGMAGLKPRAKTLVELAAAARFYVEPRPLKPDEKAAKMIAEGRPVLAKLGEALREAEWTAAALEGRLRAFAEDGGLRPAAAAHPLRAALMVSPVSPRIFEVMAVLGRDEALGRIDDAIANEPQ